MVQLHHESQRQQFTSSAWIGLYNDITSWRWSLGNEPLGSVTQWMWGQPNNKDGHEECGAVNLWGWSDEPCTDMHSFLCFNARNIGSNRYIHISNSMTWYEARNYCRQHHTDLASAR
ncbi:hypothetical protein PGIGA_G00041030, partial [Pangasianodon gigas]|nr:hypothetical protein [Pangasianodon gigas]